MPLLERDAVMEQLEGLLAEAKAGNGRAVLVRGEAGIGKTSVVRAFTGAHRGEAHVLWGGCDDLVTARPLGPVWDMALDEPELGPTIAGSDRHQVFETMLTMLSRSLRPTIVVFEDIHWADEATLDLIKFLGRRVDRTHGLLVRTYRDREVSGDRPLRAALGEVPATVLSRIVLSPLSAAAVSELAGSDAAASDELWSISGGNPFFLTELLASDRQSIPGSIRDAVTARVSKLSSPARSLVELVSVVPSRAELELAGAVLGESGAAVAETEEAGVLQVDGNALSFRHELARRSVEADLRETKRREINLAVMNAMEALGYDVARTAHHARVGGDVEALLRLAPLAARRAADMESHYEAVSHLRALEPHVDRFDDGMCADHYDLWAYEEYLLNETTRAEEIIGYAIDIRRRLGDPAKLGNSLLIASRIAWVQTRRATAVELANEAASVLEPVGGDHLAMAYSTISQLAMLASDGARTMEYGELAIAVAGEGPSQARAHATNNIGTMKMITGYPDGLEELEESYRMNGDLGLTHDQIRAAVNIGWPAMVARDLPTAELWIRRAYDMSVERELATFEAYTMASLGVIAELRGDWGTAETNARLVLDHLAGMETGNVVASTSLGRLQARRGEPSAKTHLFNGWELALQTAEVQRTGPTGAALAEFCWIGGRVDGAVFDRLREVLDDALHRSPWMAGELAFWLFLIGQIDEVPDGVAEPYLIAGSGEWARAAAIWEERGIPYDRAVTLGLGGTEAKIEALGIFDQLGAVPIAARLRSELAEAGVSGVPRGPTRATRENPYGLTQRQMEVLRHISDGLTNSEIADRLFVSSRTVDHHVSAILGKMAAASRTEATAIARHDGLLGETATPI